MSLRRELIIIAILAVTAFAYLSLKRLGMGPFFSAKTQQETSYDYMMVRNLEEASLRGLSDYPVEEYSRHWKGRRDRQPKAMDLVKNTNGADAAKAATSATNPKAAQAKVAAAKAKAAQARKKRMNVNVIEDNKVASSSDSGFDATPAYHNKNRPVVSAPAPASSEDPVQPQEDKGLSLSEWKSLLMQTPSKLNMDKLLASQRKGKLSTADFYSIISDLLVSHAEDRQKAGIYGLGSVISSESFEFIITVKAQTQDSVQTQLTALQKRYSEPAQLDEVARVALGSSKPEVAVEAMKVLKASIEQWAKQRDVVAQSGSPVRSPAELARYEQNIRSLLPGLTRISSRGETDAASLAAELVNQIESATQKS